MCSLFTGDVADLIDDNDDADGDDAIGSGPPPYAVSVCSIISLAEFACLNLRLFLQCCSTRRGCFFDGQECEVSGGDAPSLGTCQVGGGRCVDCGFELGTVTLQCQTVVVTTIPARFEMSSCSLFSVAGQSRRLTKAPTPTFVASHPSSRSSKTALARSIWSARRAATFCACR